MVNKISLRPRHWYMCSLVCERFRVSPDDEYKQMNNFAKTHLRSMVVDVRSIYIRVVYNMIIHYLQLWMVEHLVCGSYEDRSKV